MKTTNTNLNTFLDVDMWEISTLRDELDILALVKEDLYDWLEAADPADTETVKLYKTDLEELEVRVGNYHKRLEQAYKMLQEPVVWVNPNL